MLSIIFGFAGIYPMRQGKCSNMKFLSEHAEVPFMLVYDVGTTDS
jgi:hypothetical protein